MTAAFLALMGKPIRFPFPHEGESFQCYPILPLWWLALIFGAQTPPAKPPPWVLRSIRELRGRDRKAPRIEAKPAPPAPDKKPVSRADRLAWWKGFVEQYPNPDERPNVAAQLAAARAAFPNHALPSAQTMRELRLDPCTPPEWREPGPRTKSG